MYVCACCVCAGGACGRVRERQHIKDKTKTTLCTVNNNTRCCIFTSQWRSSRLGKHAQGCAWTGAAAAAAVATVYMLHAVRGEWSL